MGRRRKGRTVHGWVVVDKPAGATSTSIVGRVKRAFDAAKAGHGGTLDPFATGLLPVALGEATKTVAYVMEGPKSYRFTVRWGIATETDDPEGAVVRTSEVRPTVAAIEDALAGFVGAIEQIPPAYSAVKIAGERAYDLARAGQKPDLAPRQVLVHVFRLLEAVSKDEARFEVQCGKGTYIRALARDLAEALGTVGHLVQLRRTAAGPFAEEDAISLDLLDDLGHTPAEQQRILLPVEAALDGIPALSLTKGEAGRLRNGQAVSLLRKVDLTRIAGLSEGDTVLAMNAGQPVALTRYSRGEVHPMRVLNI